MGTFSIWHWLIVLTLVVPYPILAILAVWLSIKAHRKWWMWGIFTLIPGIGVLAFATLLTLSVGQALNHQGEGK